MLVTVLSWFATALSLGGQFLINKKKKAAFPVWIVGNILWIVVNILTTFNTANVVMYVIYTIMNIHGLIEWSRKEEQTNEV